MTTLRHEAMARSRDAIVRAAATEFAQFGYEATSFSRIAAAMSKPKSAIGYHLFPSKTDLAAAVIAVQCARWHEVDAALDVTPTASPPATPNPSATAGSGPGRPGIAHLVAMLTACAEEAWDSPLAAGAVRLLHELPLVGVTVPVDFDWRAYAREHVRAEARATGHPAEADADRFADIILDASFGVVYSGLNTGSHAEAAGRLQSLLAALQAAMRLEA